MLRISRGVPTPEDLIAAASDDVYGWIDKTTRLSTGPLQL
jgi:hypothetical protein